MVDKEKIKTGWKTMQASTGFKKTLTYLVFVAIAALFWFIMALNDSVQYNFEVKVNLYNVPDSVTFINLPPEKIHVMVRDQGANLWRNGVFGDATVNINFADFSGDGRFVVRRSELTAALKSVFGASASLLSTSVDSLSLMYTTLPGKRVPVEVSADLTPATGKIIMGNPVASPAGVVVYGTRNVLDTITRVYTEHFSRHNLEENTEVPVRLRGMANARFEPSTVKVAVEVDPLVRKQASVNVAVHHLPEGMDLLLFPSKVQVEYYVPMSKFDAASVDKTGVAVDYLDLDKNPRKLPVRLTHHNSALLNMHLLTDSVEYTLVRN